MEIDLLAKYPKSRRNLDERAGQKTEKVRQVARQFGKDFFDGDRMHGYGGFNYHPKFWQPVVPDFQKQYHLSSKSSILDVGCAKGFMLYDFKKLIPGIQVAGIDISEYAVSNAIDDVKPFLKVANAVSLPFSDKFFDLVVSINTVHNLPLDECKNALREIQRVSKKHSFVTVDAYHNAEEKKRMEMWNLTARTILSVEDWVELFRDVGYAGDYYWFIP